MCNEKKSKINELKTLPPYISFRLYHQLRPLYVGNIFMRRNTNDNGDDQSPKPDTWSLLHYIKIYFLYSPSRSMYICVRVYAARESRGDSIDTNTKTNKFLILFIFYYY